MTTRRDSCGAGRGRGWAGLPREKGGQRLCLLPRRLRAKVGGDGGGALA